VTQLGNKLTVFKGHILLPLLCLALILVLFGSFFGGCLSFLPYGYNDFFVHLPKNEEFCVSSPDGETSYKTDGRGARIIDGKDVGSPVYAFGESQLLEIFPDTRGQGHALRSLYPKKQLVIHGAPNNGPFETVDFLKYVLRTTTPKQTVIGFNFGTDVFRIIPGWKTKKYVSLASDELSAVMSFPFWYELKIAIGVIKGKFFTLKRPSLVRTRNYYNSRKKTIRRNFKSFISQLIKSTKSVNTKIDFVFYPPYWMYSQKKDESYLEEKIETEFKNFVCEGNILDPLPVTQTYIAKFPKTLLTDKLFTYDGRHFRTETLIFEPKETYCAKL
jgi:hypothetical protein